MNNIIYELSIYSIDFSDKLINKLASPTLDKISITNKQLHTPIVEIIKKIQVINPNLKIIPYHSFKYHQKASLQDTAHSLIKKLEEYQNINIKEILLISGSPKPRYNTIPVLDILATIYKIHQYPQIAIAYNPFLTGVELEIENQDIKNKLKSGIISSVYLQIGIDLPIIQKSVQYLRALQPNLDIYLSLMNPAPYRLAQFRYRPWKGVYLPEEYLQFPQYALNINNSIYQVAQTMQLGVIQGD